MPFINSKVTVKLSDEKKQTLKKQLGKIIEDIPGKSENWLMVGFDDGYSLYFKGNKMDRAAFVEVEIAGTCDRDAKNKITSDICNLFENEVGIPGDSIYVTFQEIRDWGWRGELF